MTALTINKSKSFDYLIIVARFLLAAVFISYGYSKLTNNQFGLSTEDLAKPIKDLNLMQVAWYLFDHQPFKYFIGTSQIICALLLLFRKTVLIGAILFLPIAVNILIIDLTIMPKGLKNAFAVRLSFYIFLDLLIFLYYKTQTLGMLASLTKSSEIKYKHKLWFYFLIPIFALMLDLSIGIPKLIWGLITEPTKMIHDLTEIVRVIITKK